MAQAAPPVLPMQLPMEISTGEGEWAMEVNDRNPDRSLYGGRLKASDVYIAKMYEVTHYMCTSGRQSPSLPWASSAKLPAGLYLTITCAEANSVAEKYGLGALEATPIYFSYEEAGGETKTLNIPILKITSGQKLTDWVTFTDKLRAQATQDQR